MKEIEMLQAVYDEKTAAYHRLCDAYSKAWEAANEIKAMCDEAQDDMLKSGGEASKGHEGHAAVGKTFWAGETPPIFLKKVVDIHLMCVL